MAVRATAAVAAPAGLAGVEFFIFSTGGAAFFDAVPTDVAINPSP